MIQFAYAGKKGHRCRGAGRIGCACGLLLVFMGFVYARGESYGTRTGDKFKWVAKVGILPFLITLLCAWICLKWLTGSAWAYAYSILCFEVGLYATAIYGAGDYAVFPVNESANGPDEIQIKRSQRQEI